MKLISLFLLVPFFCYAFHWDDADIYDYCCVKTDEISYVITHDLENNPIKKYKLYGELDAYLDIIHFIEFSQD